MFCHKCGNQLPNEAAFCNNCGTKTQVLAPPAAPGSAPSGKETIQLNPNAPFMPAQPTQWNNQSPYPPISQWPNASGTLPQFGSNPGNMAYPPGSPPPLSGTFPQTWNNPGGLSSPGNRGNPTYFSGPQTSPTGPYPQQGAMLPPAQQMTPMNGAQKLLVRVFGQNLASNAWFGVVLGGIFALIVGVIVMAILVNIAHAIAPHVPIQGSSSPAVDEEAIDAALGIFPLHNLFRDSLQLFLVAHGVGTRVQYGAASYFYTAPLSGFLIIPALLLVLGGYIAASTDFQNRRQSSLWRGVAIAVPYTILLFILVSQVNGCASIDGCVSASSPSTSGVLTMDSVSLFLFGILWSGLFGLLGASLKLANGQWRHRLFEYARTNARPQIMGMITGGLAAAGLGLALALLVLASFVAYSSFSLIVMQATMCPRTEDWQSIVATFIASGPLHAVNLFFYSFGAPITINNPKSYPCFYTTNPHAAFSLLSPHPGQLAWLYLLLAIPVISLFLGGRVSAALGRVQGVGQGAVQGALIVVPFTLLMMVLTALSTITSTSSDGSPSGALIVQSAGAGAFDVLLWALLSSAVLGAIGGIYQMSSAKMAGSTILSIVLFPFTAPGKLFYPLLDRISGQPVSLKRSPARAQLYNALIWAILLMIVAGIGGAIVLINSSTFTLHDDSRIRDIISVLLIAVPGLFLLSACAAALSYDPVTENQNNLYGRYNQYGQFGLNSSPAGR